MIHTVEAVIDETGQIHLAQPLKLKGVHRALVTVLDEKPSESLESSKLSETSLATDWNRAKEDEAWQHLQ